MYFKEFLRVRNSLFWYTLTLAIIAAIIAIVAVTSPEDKSTTSVSHDASGNTVVTTKYGDGGRSVTATDKFGNKTITITDRHHKSHTWTIKVGPAGSWTQTTTDSSGKTVTLTGQGADAEPAVDTGKSGADDIPWVALLVPAGMIAAILATVLGSTLAVENSHLEVAWTTPRSRTQYATALMIVDAIGIVIAQLIAFAFIIVPIATLAKVSKLIGGPDDALNVVRFILFPLAWYGLIVAFSATMRGKAGIVQGLIWPIALGLALASAAPFPAVWHRIFAAINLINPMSYITFDEHGTQIMTGSALTNVTAAVAILALMVVVSWFAATFQWRRLQA